jgi:hypothetical protein
MKKMLLLVSVCLIAFSTFAQKSVRVSKDILNQTKQTSVVQDLRGDQAPLLPVNPARSQKAPNDRSAEEFTVGYTYYDLQSNSALSSRFFRYDDGCIGATWTGGIAVTAFADRGSFYNYWTGTEFATAPEDAGRVEGYRAGWPSYAPFGETGEAVVSHGGTGVTLTTREVRGEGAWTVTTPTISSGDNTWPRMVNNNGTIHVLEGFQDKVNTSNNAVFYSRSTDNGATWNPQGVQLEEIGPTYYTTMAFSADDYIWAEPNNGVIAFALLSNLSDLIIMKSTDDGDTWEKIIPWEHPYPMFDYNTMTMPDSLWAPNGAGSLVIDDNGMCHIAFGVCRYLFAETGGTYSYFPVTGYAYYWNEDMDNFTNENQYKALDAESNEQYFEDGRLILPWGFDFDGDGDWYLDGTESIPYYRSLGMIKFLTMTQAAPDRMILALSIPDESNVIMDTYASLKIFLCSCKYFVDEDAWRLDTDWVTDPNMVSYDLYNSGAQTNNPGWFRMNAGYLHAYDECAYPQIVAQPDETVNGNFYVFYQADAQPGLALDGNTQTDYVENTYYMWVNTRNMDGNPNLPEIHVGVEEFNAAATLNMSVYPNPTSGNITINLEEAANITVYNVLGQIVKTANHAGGITNINLDNAGVYFVVAEAATQTATQKVIVR